MMSVFEGASCPFFSLMAVFLSPPTRRQQLFLRITLVVGLLALITYLLFFSQRLSAFLPFRPPPSPPSSSPLPRYEFIYRWEDNLPQHNLDLPFPEGRSGRYVKFSNQIKALGWNNCLNEVSVLHF
jgi:hypothetical protein